MTEEEMVVWHHRLNEYRFEQISEDGEGQGSLACCSPWGHKESDTPGHLNKSHIPESSQSRHKEERETVASVFQALLA